MVIADSNIWIHYLRNPKTQIGSALQALLDTDGALMVGVVLAEVLQGARTEREYTTLLPRLEAVPYEEVTKQTWSSAGRIGLQLRTEGRLIPLTDIVIAAQALEGDHQVFSLDAHFERIQDLKLYSIPS